MLTPFCLIGETMTKIKSGDLFSDIHHDIPREGPGAVLCTRHAFSLMTALPTAPTILDIGCGPGMQTLDLAAMTDGQITAVDTEQRFLDELIERATQAGCADRIHPVRESMFSLSFPPDSFDVIWSEGAIYIMGFAEGLRAWRSLLRAGGYIAVTQICWLRTCPSDEAVAFWRAAYPSMQSVEAHLEEIGKAGYQSVGHFALPESAWWDHYYSPLESRLASLRKKYADDANALAGIAEPNRKSTSTKIIRKTTAMYSSLCGSPNQTAYRDFCDVQSLCKSQADRVETVVDGLRLAGASLQESPLAR
jgi:SAM-dependent methyltransferase